MAEFERSNGADGFCVMLLSLIVLLQDLSMNLETSAAILIPPLRIAIAEDEHQGQQDSRDRVVSRGHIVSSHRSKANHGVSGEAASGGQSCRCHRRCDASLASVTRKPVSGRRGHSVEEAQARLAQGEYSIVLLDVQLGNETGDELLAHLRQLEHTPATVVVTGHRSDRGEVIDSMMHDGATSVCYKPVDMHKLLELIDRLAQADN